MNAEPSFLSITPPLLVLVLGCWTRNVILSLAAGIILAVLVAANFSLLPAMELLYSYLWSNFEFDKFFSIQQFWSTWNLFICIFLLILGIFVCLLQHSGGAYAYASFAKKYINNRKNAETSSLILSILLFVDDYFSNLTVGSVMYPLTDTQKIPRAKLAFLVGSMSAPLTILSPVSSWAAAILGLLRDNGISQTLMSGTTTILAKPLTAYFYLLPFLFYSFILILSVWYIVRMRISFGLMKKHEELAISTGNLFGGRTYYSKKKSSFEPNPRHTTLSDFFISVLILLVSIFGGILYSGKWSCLFGHNDLITAFQNSSAATALFLGGNIALIVCTLFLLIRGRIELKAVPKIYWHGIKLMLSAVIVLLLAWTLGDILRSQGLQTGKFLANILVGTVDITLLPALLFITAVAIAFSIGSAWGTNAILFPIAIQMIPSILHINTIPTLTEIPIFLPAFGAILSGSVAGNHMSPISDTTIMSSASTKITVIDRVNTQFSYALPIIIFAAMGFMLSAKLIHLGILVATIIPIIISTFASILTLQLLHCCSSGRRI